MKAKIYLLSCVSLFTFTSFVERGKWLIQSESRLTIYGTSNVSDFVCRMDSYASRDTLEYNRDPKSSELTFIKNRMTIPIRNFDCGNNQITKDFRHTLQVDKHPHLDVRFISLQNFVASQPTVQGFINITLAGKTTRYVVVYEVKRINAKTIKLVGKQFVNFSDFNLEPPQKMFGLIQVAEQLNVEFDLFLKEV